MQFINSPEDMAWLRDVFKLPNVFGSAVIYGNEDSPDRIDLFYNSEPEFYQAPDQSFIPDN